VIDAASLHELIGRWWWSYDEGRFDAFPGFFASDAHFTCRTDTGTTDYEEFVRADVRGQEAVVAWQIEHRTNSPYPLRHNGTNVHLVDVRGDEADFASYILVTQIAGGVSPVSTALVTGTVRIEDGALRIAALHVVLDTMESVGFSERALDSSLPDFSR
jgi:SnoaL-like domain